MRNVKISLIKIINGSINSVSTGLLVSDGNDLNKKRDSFLLNQKDWINNEPYRIALSF
jgi:hypothetical protein